MSDEPIRWRDGKTARRKRIGIEVGGCGWSACASAIHIESTRPTDNDRPAPWLEIHLTPEETQWVIDCLSESLKRREGDRDVTA